jgi:hypothetical protein
MSSMLRKEKAADRLSTRRLQHATSGKKAEAK